MKIINAVIGTNPDTFSPIFKIQFEIEVPIELLIDMPNINQGDVESELSSILGKELVELLKGYKFCV